MAFDERILRISILLITCSSSVASNTTYARSVSKICQKNQFECSSGQCISEELFCNGKEDCDDGSDETKNCANVMPCWSHFLFRCDYGACIDKKRQCDGKKDCKDGSDESEAACGNCGKNKFKCGSGECVDKSFLCDGIADCNDNSDETRTECVNTICPLYSFRCGYGACIIKRFKCNGIPDCVDGSDETACTNQTALSPSARASKFRCDSGQIIDEHDICDGTDHCSDKSDETEKLCGDLNCPFYTYRCKYGACVNKNARCNGIVNCVDSSDEEGCNFGTKPEIVPYCQKNEFKCESGMCVNENRVCDGRKDCDDGTDEVFRVCAYRRCNSSSFTCNYGACVPKMTRCNGVFDCVDASDEHGCSESLPNAQQNLSFGCVIPRNPDFGSYQVANVKMSPGEMAPPYSVLIPKCDKGYGTLPPEELFSVCIGEKWNPDPPSCGRICPLIESTSSVVCKFNNKVLKTCSNSVQGTVALVQCDPGKDGVVKSIVNFCESGLWNAPINECIPTKHTNNNSSYVNIFYIFNKDNRN